jgi:hypothetical protein
VNRDDYLLTSRMPRGYMSVTRLYVVLSLQNGKSGTFDWMGWTKKANIIFTDKGMIGYLPVFDSREAAEALAGSKYDIMEIMIK